MIIALKDSDIAKAVSLWQKYRSEEPEEHLYLFVFTKCQDVFLVISNEKVKVWKTLHMHFTFTHAILHTGQKTVKNVSNNLSQELIVSWLQIVNKHLVNSLWKYRLSLHFATFSRTVHLFFFSIAKHWILKLQGQLVFDFHVHLLSSLFAIFLFPYMKGWALDHTLKSPFLKESTMNFELKINVAFCYVFKTNCNRKISTIVQTFIGVLSHTCVHDFFLWQFWEKKSNRNDYTELFSWRSCFISRSKLRSDSSVCFLRKSWNIFN